MRSRLIILSAPLIVLVEWSAFVLTALRYPLDIELPISAMPYYYPSYIWIYASTIIAASLCFCVFSLALSRIWKPAFAFSIICSVLATVAAFTLFNPNGGLESEIHELTANLASLGLGFILFMVCFNGTGHIKLLGKIFGTTTVVGIIAVLASIHIYGAGAAWAQLLLVINVHTWMLLVAYDLWKQLPRITQ